LTRIKICGITKLEDALQAIECGADALGFILVPDSPRYIGGNPGSFRIPLLLPPFISRVAVCKDAETCHAFREPCFDAIQFYSPQWTEKEQGRTRLIQAFRIMDEKSLDEIEACQNHADAYLLDTWRPDMLGGSGECFNWNLARIAKERFNKPIILAGGLTPENVGEAIRTVHPYAVDISSGVEKKPGCKDHAKVRAFCDAVRLADEEYNDEVNDAS
jgi:phosphoribosylanthranilate isomerase